MPLKHINKQIHKVKKLHSKSQAATKGSLQHMTKKIAKKWSQLTKDLRKNKNFWPGIFSISGLGLLLIGLVLSMPSGKSAQAGTGEILFEDNFAPAKTMPEIGACSAPNSTCRSFTDVSPNSLYFGNRANKNYSAGGELSSQGGMQYRNIALNSTTGPLRLYLQHKIEVEGGANFDKASIQVIEVGNPNNFQKIDVKTLPDGKMDGTVYVSDGSVEIPLGDNFLGKKVDVIFSFNSMDHLFNDFYGWEVRNWRILSGNGSANSSTGTNGTDLLLPPIQEQQVWSMFGSGDWRFSAFDESKAGENLWRKDIVDSPCPTGANCITGGIEGLLYEKDGKYETGREANSGRAVSPEIKVKPENKYSLKFDSLLDVENLENYDNAIITVEGKNAQGNMQTLAAMYKKKGAAANEFVVSQELTTGTQFVPQSLNFSTPAGVESVQITLSFETVDAVSNATSGWKVRNMNLFNLNTSFFPSSANNSQTVSQANSQASLSSSFSSISFSEENSQAIFSSESVSVANSASEANSIPIPFLPSLPPNSNSSANSNASNLLQTTVKGEFEGAVTFTYDKNSKVLSYKGTVPGSDGCAYLYSHELKPAAGEKFDLVYKTGSKSQNGQICTMALIPLTIEGSQALDLSEQQMTNFGQLFSLVRFKATL